MTQEVIVRQYRPGDLDEVVAMWSASKRAAYTYIPVQQLYTIENDRHYFQEVIVKDCDVWLADSSGEIVGMMALREYLIDQLFVRLGDQRCGVGTGLLQMAKDLSPDGLMAYTFQKNSAAREFFEKNGFECVRSGISPPPENEPDLEYAWNLLS